MLQLEFIAAVLRPCYVHVECCDVPPYPAPHTPQVAAPAVDPLYQRKRKGHPLFFMNYLCALPVHIHPSSLLPPHLQPLHSQRRQFCGCGWRDQATLSGCPHARREARATTSFAASPLVYYLGHTGIALLASVVSLILVVLTTFRVTCTLD